MHGIVYFNDLGHFTKHGFDLGKISPMNVFNNLMLWFSKLETPFFLWLLNTNKYNHVECFSNKLIQFRTIIFMTGGTFGLELGPGLLQNKINQGKTF